MLKLPICGAEIFGRVAFLRNRAMGAGGTAERGAARRAPVQIHRRWSVSGLIGALLVSIFLVTIPTLSAAKAQSIANPVAVFSGLDKITGRIITFDVYIDETVQFGALQITPRVCYTRPSNQVQRTSSFIEVDQVSLQQTLKRIFTGWMFADSPALNAIDNAVYDVWLVDCKTSSDVPPPDNR